MNKEQLRQYLLQAINMALDSDGTETSYTNSFDIQVKDNGFNWIPRIPSSFIINVDLYQKIYEIANLALYPQFTLLKMNNMYTVPLKTQDLHVQRTLFFPWIEGIPERLIIDSNESQQDGHYIHLMKNLKISYEKVTSIAIAGNSGSGKSYFLNYLLDTIYRFSNLTIIDPKMDSPARWARAHNVKAIFPDANRSKADFVSQINEVLSEKLQLIHARQKQLYINPKQKFKAETIALDEILSIVEGLSKPIYSSFASLISQIALLGRSTSVHLLLVSRRLDHTTLPTSVREQANVLVQLGNINSRTTQFLFPDLDPRGIVIPLGKGTGLIQIIDPDYPAQVLPFLAPTY